ncbi:hypothetical protein RCZ04_13290 [Capnocytophaga sp. HP1101]
MNPLLMRGQEVTRIRGKVFYNNVPIESVHIENIDNQHYTITDAEGSFTIEAQKGHTLKATYVGKKTAYHTLTQVDLQKLIVLKIADITIALDEVSVTEKPKITAQSLGILQHTPKERTWEEKREYANVDILQIDKLTLYKLLVGNVSFNFNAIINHLSGKAKIIKKQVVNEKNLKVAHYIVNEMSNYLKNEHHLTEEEIGTLAFYVMEKPEVHRLVERKDNKQLEFMLYECLNEMRITQTSN